MRRCEVSTVICHIVMSAVICHIANMLFVKLEFAHVQPALPKDVFIKLSFYKIKRLHAFLTLAFLGV